jgi:tRNA(Ile)-lysidine synthetase-like protein
MSQPTSSERIVRAMQQRLLRALRADFVNPPTRLIVGFSGGADSLALALVLKRIQGAIPSRIELLHIDHHLRSDSTEDAEAARALASSLGLPIIVRDIQENVRQLHPGVGIEEAARRERYLQFQDECDDDDVVVLGHHAQDQAETILMHLMRGAGLQGAAGMTRVSSIDVPWWGHQQSTKPLHIWRPLLAEDRAELRMISHFFDLIPVEDPSNASEAYRRNALRHRIVPILKEIEPGAINAMGRFGQIASEDDRLLSQLAEEQLEAVSDQQDGLLVAGLLELDVALRRRVVHKWLSERTGEPPTFERVAALLTLAESGNESAVVEIARDQVAGIFRNSVRCGSRSSLEELARQDAGLVLPLWDANEIGFGDDSVVVVRNNGSLDGAFAIPQPRNPFERINVRPVRDEPIVGAGIDRSEWMRRAGISPWIRDRVTGIALDDRMWWIPRMSDDYEGEKPLYVRWVAEEIN